MTTKTTPDGRPITWQLHQLRELAMTTNTSDDRYQNLSNLLDDNSNQMYNTISAEDYAQFEREWVIYILKEYRYGQAFCEHFGLGETLVLYYFNDEGVSRRWIKENYLQSDNSV